MYESVYGSKNDATPHRCVSGDDDDDDDNDVNIWVPKWCYSFEIVIDDDDSNDVSIWV